MKQYNKAEDYYLQALSVHRQISQEADSEDIANTLGALGLNYSIAGDEIKAKEWMKKSLDMFIRVSPEDPKVELL